MSVEYLAAQLAYRNWQKAGRPKGGWEVFWDEAERELGLA
jgi:hypothetical protein